MPELKDWEGCWNIDEISNSITFLLKSMNNPGDCLEIKKRYDEPDGGFHITKNGSRIPTHPVLKPDQKNLKGRVEI